MFDIKIRGTEKQNPYEELIKVFLQPGEYRMADKTPESGEDESSGQPLRKLEYVFGGDADELKRRIYGDLAEATGKKPKWGILTGIRPVKLAFELLKKEYPEMAEDGAKASEEAMRRVREILMERYLLHPEKAALTAEILEYQRMMAGDPPKRGLSLYIGIPFCPTRCLYCSFTSNQKGEEEIRRYLEALHREIRYAGEAAEKDGFRIESVYIGGGTPTTLDAEQLDSLLSAAEECFDLGECREFTVEAGRPDTFTDEKMDVLRRHGTGRISVNPQSMKQETLDRIGRRCTVRQAEEAFAMAKKAGFQSINADLIAGLPGESFEDFRDSLEKVISLGADNITLHTLAVKRASRLKDWDAEFNYRAEDLREEMLSCAGEKLRASGFLPYYLYRQKHTSGSTENIGYCRDGLVSVYNIRIMEERESILALGAGGISKIWFPAENRLERVANVSNYEIYIDRIDEMIERKKQGFFGQNR